MNCRIWHKFTWSLNGVIRGLLFLVLFVWNLFYLFGVILDPYGLRPEEVFSQGLHLLLLLSSLIPLLPPFPFMESMREISILMITTAWFTIVLDICHIISYRQTQQHFHFSVIIAGLILDLVTLLAYCHYLYCILCDETSNLITIEEENMGSPAICSICFQKPESKLTNCAHKLCNNCYDDAIKNDPQVCPFCRYTLTKCKDLIVKAVSPTANSGWV